MTYLKAIDIYKRREFISKTCRDLKLWGLDKFDTVAFTGMSGALVAPQVADILDKQMLLVRKPQDKSHGALIETAATYSSPTATKILIIDDFFVAGETINRIVRSILNLGADELITSAGMKKFVGIYLYNTANSDSELKIKNFSLKCINALVAQQE